MKRVAAPVSTEGDRRHLSEIIARIRPDWDRHGIAAALAKHPEQNLDILAAQAVIAAVTRTDQRTPALLGLDGDHTNRARSAFSDAVVTPAPLTGRERGADCATCGVPKSMHAGARASLQHGEHDWTAAEPVRPASPQAIANARRAAFSTKGNR
jgi:hypothetical protein